MRSIIRTVDVAKPLRHVYDQWTRFEDLAGIMPGVASVRQLDERTTSWVVVVSRERREFAAVTTEQRPDNRIAWKGLGVPEHSGVVTFHHLDSGTTRVTVQIDWEPVGTFDLLGDRLGLVARQVDTALDGFARHVEAHRVPLEGWRGTIEPSDDDVPDAVAAAARVRADGRGRKVERIGDDASRHRWSADGRGRTADSPMEMPARGWQDSLKRAAKQLKTDNVQILAAAVAFYLFLSLIPTLAASISLYGLVADPTEVTNQIAELTTGLPEAAANLIVAQAEEAAGAEVSTLSISLVVSVAAALFSASKGTQALVKALNIAYNEEETRGFVKLRLLALGLTVGIIAVAVGVVAALVAVADVAKGMPGGGGLVTALRWPALGTVLVLVLATMYRFSPDRDAARWRWMTPGAVLAAVLLAVGSLGLSVYTSNFGGEATSGFLGAVGVLLLWLFLSAYVVLFGAELDSELEHQTAMDTTKGPSRPMGKRDATMADTVAR
ncbi:MAG: YhjD/YihY/BrkB family envelope integrity protein [Acidimicrobiales bacterium]